MHPAFSETEGLKMLVNSMAFEKIYYTAEAGEPLMWREFVESLPPGKIKQADTGEIVPYRKGKFVFKQVENANDDIRNNYAQGVLNTEKKMLVYGGGDLINENFDYIVPLVPFEKNDFKKAFGRAVVFSLDKGRGSVYRFK